MLYFSPQHKLFKALASKWIFTLLIAFSPAFLLSSEKTLPADISFLTFDFKYNEEDGVKICEMQQGITASFPISKPLYGSRLHIHRMVYRALRERGPKLWLVGESIAPAYFDAGLYERVTGRWFFEDLRRDPRFVIPAMRKNQGREALANYQVLLACHYKFISDPVRFQEKFPSALLLNRPFIPYLGSDQRADKSVMSRLFTENPMSAYMKPYWSVYPRGDSEELVERILRDFSSDILVIKPLQGFDGRGVIITPREELQETLTQIFRDNLALIDHSDKGYKYWGEHDDGEFIVEEFFPSDPVLSPRHDDRPFDGTMRIAMLFTCDRGEIELYPIQAHWQLPAKSLDEEGFFNERHVSSTAGECSCLVEEELLERVMDKMREGLIPMYRRLLRQGHSSQ